MRLLEYDCIDSTNDEAKRLIKSGEPPGFAVTAVSQTAGRGRFNRVWQTPKGNLAMTITASLPTFRPDQATIALMTGIVIHEALISYLEGVATVHIKWPNDILVNGAKVSGTLIEVDQGVMYVGIGINVVSKPTGVAYPTFALSDLIAIDPPRLAGEVFGIWNNTFHLWQENGFAGFLTRYNSRLHSFGEQVRFTLDRDRTEWVAGRCHGVNEQGHILIGDQSGVISAYAAGDVDISEKTHRMV